MDQAQLQTLVTAAVPFVLWLVKRFVANWIPDAVIVEIRDEVVPLLAPVAGVLIQGAAAGQFDLTGGAVAGLAGVGLHQVVKQAGRIKEG